MITKKFSVRKIKVDLPLEKKLDLLVFLCTVLLFSITVPQSIKKKAIKNGSKHCGISNYFTVVPVVLSKK